MDSTEEAKEYNNNNNSSSSSSCCNNTTNNDHGTYAMIVKGKRTKRRRLHLPPASAVAGPTTTSSASSVEFSSSITEEDEDMANCLMLLSRGHNEEDQRPEWPAAEEGGVVDRGGRTEKLIEATATTTEGKPGSYVYECKTCNKCFPSFQALGGHRASHNKPKMAVPIEEKKPVADEDELRMSMYCSSKPAVAPNDSNKSRVHECAICGSEFSSGQALGGHMRRHRPLTTTTETPEIKKEIRNVLSLDLNLPALPSDDDHDELPTLPSALAFPLESQQPLVFPGVAAGRLPLLSNQY